MGLFTDAFGAIKEYKDGEGDKEFAQQQAKRLDSDHWKRIEAMDFDYAKPSEAAPQYKATVSPVARAYLESFLTGANPDAVQGTRAGSSGLLGGKAQAQGAFTKAYGGWDKLKQQGDAELSAPDRFAVKPLASVSDRVDRDAESSLRNPQNAPLEKTLGRPLSADEIEYLNKVWKVDQNLGGKTGSDVIPGNNPTGYMLMRMNKDAIERLLRDRPADGRAKTIVEYQRG